MIVFDLILATRRPALSGIERYGINLFEAMRRQAPETVAFVSDTHPFASSEGLYKVGSALKGWLSLPMALRRRGVKPDSIVFPSFPASPLFRAAPGKLCRIIHDGFPWTRGDGMTLQGRVMFRHLENAMMGRYDAVCAPTAPVAQELQALTGRAGFTDIGNAPGQALERPAMPVHGLEARKFVLAVGTIEPRKNYAGVIELARRLNGSGHRIVVAGRPGWGGVADEVAAAAADPAGNLVWLNEASDGNIVWLYQKCDAFISLSHAEGFNMPLVEAAMTGRPVVCSDLPIHRYVAPPWARFVATDAPAIEIAAALADPPAIDAEALDAYKARFSWDKIASRLSIVMA